MHGVTNIKVSSPEFGMNGYFPSGSTDTGAPLSRFYVVGISNSTALGASTVGLNLWRAIPHYFPKDVTIESVNINITVTGSSDSNVAVGIYSNKEPYIIFPDKLMWESGNYAGNVSGVSSKPCSIQLKAGLYWFSYNVGGTTSPTLRTISTNGQAANLQMIDTAMGTTNLNQIAVASVTYGAFPYAIPTGTVVVSGNSVYLAIGLKISSYDT